MKCELRQPTVRLDGLLTGNPGSYSTPHGSDHVLARLRQDSEESGLSGSDRRVVALA